MLTITKDAPDFITVDFHGDLDADAMRTALDDLIAHAADMSGGKMLYRIGDFSFPTLGAIAVEMTRLPQLFQLLGKIDRCAVLSDTSWVRHAAEVEGALFPGIDIKAFEANAETEARAWLDGVSEDNPFDNVVL